MKKEVEQFAKKVSYAVESITQISQEEYEKKKLKMNISVLSIFENYLD